MTKANALRAPKLVVRRDRIELREDGGLRIAVVADTHSQLHPRAIERLTALAPGCILHAGDIGDLAVLDALRTVATTYAIRGNIDTHAADLPDAITLGVGSGARTLFDILLFHIAVYGPKLRADAARLAQTEGASLVICGHSHVPFIGRDRGLAIFNPGSIGPRRFQLPIVFGVLEIHGADPPKISMHHVDCVTGERWSP